MRQFWANVALVLLTLLWVLPAAPLEAATIAAPAPHPLSQPGCFELVVNGNFASAISPAWSTQGWVIRDTSVWATPVSPASARIGLQAAGPNQNNTSTLSQSIFLPAGYNITLSFQYFPRFNVDIPDDDEQFAEIQAAGGRREPLLPARYKQNLGNWQTVSGYPLDTFAGQQITLVFGVFNDGVGSITWINVDNVSIIACPAPPTVTPTPTTTVSPTPTFTATPLPAGCVSDGILNGSFEDNSFWVLGDAPVPPAFVGSPVYDGLRSARLGIDPGAVPVIPASHPSYSSIRQPFQISPMAGSASLSWWHFDRTEEGVLESIPRGLAIDRQEVILLNLDNSTAGVLYRKRLNTNAWRQDTVDLTGFIGRPLVLYFNTFNDSNALRTWQFIDKVVMTVCYPPTATPTPTSPPTPTPPPTDTPTPTSTPTDTPPPAEVVPFLAPVGDEPQQANGLVGSGEPTVIALAGQRLPEAATPAPTPTQPQTMLAFLNDRPLTDALATIGVLLGGLALIGMLTWLIIWNRRRHG
jgi:hypothetical protein